jgi:uncharacterized protein involved in outer membrane biogenesis
VLALVCLGLAAVAFVLVAPPLDAVRDRLIRQAEARTGRTLTVAGPMSVSLLPHVVVTLHGVAMPPPEGMQGAATVAVPSIEAEMSLWSLLSRRPRFDRLTLIRPTIELAVDAQGRRSWDSPGSRDKGASPPAAEAAPGRGRAVPAAQKRSRRPPRPLLVRIVDGTVHYRDERSGTHREIGALSLDLRLANSEDPVAVAGALAWEGVPFQFQGSVSPAQVAFKLEGAPLEASYEGTLTLKDGLAADGSLRLQRIAYKDLQFGPGVIGLSLHQGVAKLNLQELEAYGGRGAGTLSIDATGAKPAVAADLKLSGISLQPLLRAASGGAWLEGRGAITLALNTQGGSEAQLLEALQGQMQVAVTEGAVHGFDVDRAMRALQRARLDRLAPRRDDRTPFSGLNGTFQIANGIAKTQDLKLASSHVQLAGDGAIELVPRRIDLTLQTKIEGGPPAEGAVVKIGTLELPISIKGPLDRPEFTIKGQEELTGAIKQIGKNLRSPEVQDALKSLLGGNGDKHVKPGDVLEKLLKRD